MARRRSRTPAILLPVVVPAKAARKAQKRRRANQRLDQRTERMVDAAYDKVQARTPVKGGRGSKAAPAPEPAKSDAKAWRFRNRHWLRAVWAALALATSKAFVVGPWIFPAVGMIMIGGLLVAGAWWLTRPSRRVLPELASLTAKVPERGRRYVEALLSPAAGAAVTAGFALYWWAAPLALKPAAWLLVGGTALVAAFRAFRFRVVPAEAPGRTVGSREADWDEFIAGRVTKAKGSKMVGSGDYVVDGKRLGWEAGIVLPKGSDPASEVAPAVRGKVATTYGVGDQGVMIDLDRTTAARFRLTVLDEPGSNALEQIHVYDGSDFDEGTGIWTQAIRADWSGSLGQLYDRKIGGFSIHVSGETGGGKSEAMETVLRSVTSRGVVVPVIVDLGGATFGDWEQHSAVFVRTPEDALQLLANYNTLIAYRNRELGKMRNIVDGEDVGPRRVYPVDREHPAILLVFDEWQFAINDPTWGVRYMELTKDILTQQRKVIMPMLLAGQSTGLNEGFKGSNAVRTQLQAGTMIALKNNAESGYQAFGNNIKVDPSNIPLDIKGACYMTSNADARDAMARGRWVEAPRRHDAEIDVPPLPADQLAILTRRLGEARPLAVQVPAQLPALTPGEAAPVPAVGPPTARLKQEIELWLAEREDGAGRPQIVEEFSVNRGVAGKTKVYEAIKELAEAGVIDIDDSGVCRAKVRTES